MIARRVLTRSRTDRMVAGVCGGISHHLDLDPVFVRLGFVALTVFGGAGALLYLILACWLPDERGSTGADYFAPAGRTRCRGARLRTVGAVAMIVVGSFWLLNQLGVSAVFRSDVVGPMILVFIGLGLYLRARGRF